MKLLRILVLNGKLPTICFFYGRVVPKSTSSCTDYKHGKNGAPHPTEKIAFFLCLSREVILLILYRILSICTVYCQLCTVYCQFCTVYCPFCTVYCLWFQSLRMRVRVDGFPAGVSSAACCGPSTGSRVNLVDSARRAGAVPVNTTRNIGVHRAAVRNAENPSAARR